MNLLHIGDADSRFPSSGPFVDAQRQIGELKVVRYDGKMTEEEKAALIRGNDVLLTLWGSSRVPE